MIGILSRVNHKNYITAKNNVQSVFYLLCTQVIKPQIIQKPQNQSCTQIYIKQNTHKHQTQNFRRISPFGIAPVKKKKKTQNPRSLLKYSESPSLAEEDDCGGVSSMNSEMAL